MIPRTLFLAPLSNNILFEDFTEFYDPSFYFSKVDLAIRPCETINEMKILIIPTYHSPKQFFCSFSNAYSKLSLSVRLPVLSMIYDGVHQVVLDKEMWKL